jgi:hypothetical protein
MLFFCLQSFSNLFCLCVLTWVLFLFINLLSSNFFTVVLKVPFCLFIYLDLLFPKLGLGLKDLFWSQNWSLLIYLLIILFMIYLTLWSWSSSKYYLSIQSVPQREHYTSPLLRYSSYRCSKK